MCTLANNSPTIFIKSLPENIYIYFFKLLSFIVRGAITGFEKLKF